VKRKGQSKTNPQSGDAVTLTPVSSELPLDVRPKPPLKWAGGKRWVVPYLAPLGLHTHPGRYLEPFCGGLAAPLGLQPERAVLDDLNPHLIKFYLQVQRGLEIRIEVRNDEQLFYRHRQRFNDFVKQGEITKQRKPRSSSTI